MTMTSRERVMAAINHQQPDRVPIDLGASHNTGISASALYRLRKYYGLETKPIDIYETAQLIGNVDDDLKDILGVDVIGLHAANDCTGVPQRGIWKDFTMPDGTPIRIDAGLQYKVENGKTYLYPQGNTEVEPSFVMPAGGYFFDAIDRAPEFDEDDLTPKEDFAEDFQPISDDAAEWYAENAKLLRDTTDKAIFGCFGLGSIGDAFQIPGAHTLHPKGIRNYENWSMAQLLYPEYIEEVFDMWTESVLKNLEIYYQAIGDNIDVINISGTDFGTQVGPLMSMDTFRELYKPYYKKMNDWVHTHTKWKVHFHSCGAVEPFIEDFIDMGVDILNPVQIGAAGMEAQALKDKYGSRITFWGGGVDTQNLLPNGTPEEIRQQVRERLNILARGGGYVFNTIHNVMGNVPAENVAACFEAARDFRF